LEGASVSDSEAATTNIPIVAMPAKKHRAKAFNISIGALILTIKTPIHDETKATTADAWDAAVVVWVMIGVRLSGGVKIGLTSQKIVYLII
jgi:hypothetical protein